MSSSYGENFIFEARDEGYKYSSSLTDKKQRRGIEMGRHRKPREEIMKTISINLKQKVLDGITVDILDEESKRVIAKRRIEQFILTNYKKINESDFQ